VIWKYDQPDQTDEHEQHERQRKVTIVAHDLGSNSVLCSQRQGEQYEL
jgi:hypothetical protein